MLKAIAERVNTEMLEEQAGEMASTAHEPMLDLVHGLPGTGKSRVIAWIRELLEDVLRWEHGVEFVCLAFQNSMAAHIDGATIHHWSTIQVGEALGAARDKNKLSIRC